MKKSHRTDTGDDYIPTAAALHARFEQSHADRYPDGCQEQCAACAERLDWSRAHAARDAIAKKFGHSTSGLGKKVERG